MMTPQQLANQLEKIEVERKNAMREALVALGETPQEVSASLKRLGISGICRSPRGCPIAKYLKGKGFNEVVASASTVSSRWFSEDTYYEISVRTPSGVGVFMNQFDVGEYMDLIEANGAP